MNKPLLLAIKFLSVFSAMVTLAGQEASYQLVREYQAEFATDMVLFVKKIDDKVIMLDRKGNLEILFIKNNSLRDVLHFAVGIQQEINDLDNIFVYQDVDGNELLVGYQRDFEALIVVNLSDPKESRARKFYIGSPFMLFQKRSGDLVAAKSEHEAFTIYPRWRDAKGFGNKKKDVDLTMRPVHADDLFDLRNEQLWTTNMDEEMPQIQLDMTVLSTNGNARILSLYCGGDDVVMGFDWGKIALWSKSRPVQTQVKKSKLRRAKNYLRQSVSCLHG